MIEALLNVALRWTFGEVVRGVQLKADNALLDLSDVGSSIITRVKHCNFSKKLTPSESRKQAALNPSALATLDQE